MLLVLRAAHFAATKHADQRRKNAAATPYINHPLEVAEHLCRVGGVTDETVLAAALLHDTIEDTATSYEELQAAFGSRIADLVQECTDDKSLPKAERKRRQIERAPFKSADAKQITVADKSCNLRSILADPPAGWPAARQREYFDWAARVVAGLRGSNPALDEEVAAVLAEGRVKFGDADDPA